MKVQASLLSQRGEGMKERVLFISDVCDRVGVSDTTIWRWRRAGLFPEPRSVLGSSVKGWTATTINEWIVENFGDEQGGSK